MTTKPETIPWHACAAEFGGTFFVSHPKLHRWTGFAAGVRSVFRVNLFHTDRYRCHLADCRFPARHPSAGGASRKEDLS
jgi:hypothetical protein